MCDCMAAMLGLVIGVCLTLFATVHSDALKTHLQGATEGTAPPKKAACEVTRTPEEQEWILRRNSRLLPQVQIRTRPIYDYRYPSKLEQGGFTKVGTVTGMVDGQTQVLPLYSRPTGYQGRFHYHSKVTGFDGQPVAVHYKGRDCLNSDLGCDEIFDGDNDDQVTIPQLTEGSFRPYMFN